jgi:protoheme IX farnesyltransferase
MSRPATAADMSGAIEMPQAEATIATPIMGRGWSAIAADYLELAKPRVVAMVLLTTIAGYYLGSAGAFDYSRALKLLIGTALAAAGTLALNQYLERDLDARMMRTRRRPLPDGRLRPGAALLFGATTAVAGCAYLWFAANPLTAVTTASITVVYLFAYTPLKRVSSICSVVGALPGALPPVAGWAAARGTLGVEPLILFAIMFLWQLPHSLAIAQLYQADYARAGIRLLPTEDPRGQSTGRQVVLNAAALIAVAMLPTPLGFAGAAYFFIAFGLGAAQLYYGIRMAAAPKASERARHLMLASLIYLPGVLLMLVLDRV